MIENNREGKFAYDSPITWAFLFCAIVVIPLFVLTHMISGFIDESREAGLNLLKQDLKDMAREVEKRLSPNPLIVNLVEFLKRDINRLRSSSEILERKFPGAFKWLAWNPKGGLFNLPQKISINGKKMWGEIASKYLKNSDQAGSLIRDNMNSDPVLKQLQTYFGPNLRGEDFLKSSGVSNEFKWLGKKQLLFWRDLNLAVGKTRANEMDRLGGVLLSILPENLPEDFWMQMLIEGPFPCVFDRNSALVKINMGDPYQFIFPKSLKRKKSLAGMLRQSFLKRTEDVFIINDWLVMTVGAFNSGQNRLLLISSVKDIENRTREWQKRKIVFSFALLLLAFISFILVGNGSLKNISLKWRIAGLFTLAIFLPTSGLFYFFSALVVTEKEQGKKLVQENFRKVAFQLDSRFKDIPARYGKSLYKKLQNTLKNVETEDQVVVKLDGLLKEGFISKYFLSDDRGEVVKMGSNGDLTKDILNFTKLLMRVTFKENLGWSDPQASLGEVVMEEAGSVGEGKKGETLKLSRPTELIHYNFGKYDRNIMFITPTINRTTRVLMIEVENKMLAKAFSIEEFKANRFSGKNFGRIELNFDVTKGFFRVPEASPIWKNTYIFTAVQDGEEFSGEIEVEKERFLCFVPGNKENDYYRPVLLSSLKPILDKAVRRQHEFLVTAGFAVCSALILGIVLALKLLIPIRRLDGALALVGKGELNIEMPSIGNDEIGRMSISFNSMVQGLRERARMSAYVSETVLEAVKEEAQDEKNNGKVIEATVLFSDIRSFTTLCEKHSPQAIYKMLNDFFGGLESRIRRYGGRIDKFIGDAVMAVFLKPGRNQAYYSVLAAIAMKEFLLEFNASRKAANLFQIDIGIGISTGKVMMGDVGSSRRKDLTVIGDEVNLASRLESASKNGRHSHIILSETTWKKVLNRVLAQEMSITAVKGKDQAVRMFEFIRLLSPREFSLNAASKTKNGDDLLGNQNPVESTGVSK